MVLVVLKPLVFVSVATTDYLCRRGDCPGDDIQYDYNNFQLCKVQCDSVSNCIGFLGLHWVGYYMCYLKYTLCEETTVSTQPGQFCDNGKHPLYILATTLNLYKLVKVHCVLVLLLVYVVYMQSIVDGLTG